jgi:crotonobetainyl-CoA:carnitine CoA-transferase CaiB-like acyl-CoA transferase
VVSLVLTYAITTALFHRERTGEGQQIEVPMFESMVAWLMVEHLYGESYVPAIAPTGYPRVLSPDRRPYRTKDGHIGVLPYHDGHWRRFFELVGHPELMDDPRYRSASARLDNIDTLYATLEGFLGEKTTAEWQEIFDNASIPATPINTTDDLLEDPHLTAVGFWQEMDHPSEGRVRHYGFGPNFAATPASIRRQAPRHGEHTREVLGEAGLGEAEIDELIASGAAVQAAPLS